MAIQSDGKIVAVGTGIPGGERVARFNANGSLDTTFGTASVADLPLNGALLWHVSTARANWIPHSVPVD